jgi:PAS domain S-box-containing protein
MLKPKLPSSDVFLAGYSIILSAAGAVLILLGGPDRLLFLTMAPIIFAALFYPRRVYLLTSLITFVVSAWVIAHIARNFTTSLQTLGIATFTIVSIAEVLHRAIVARVHAQAALRTSEARFRGVVEHLGEGLIITDLHDTVLYVNSRMTELFGYTAREMIGQPAPKLISSSATWPASRGQGDGERRETQMIGKDGRLFWAEISLMPFRDPSGSVIGTIGAITDISERKQAQRRSAAFSALGHRLSAATTAESAAGIVAVVADELLGWDAFLLDLYVAEEDAISPVLMMDVVGGQRKEVARPSMDRSPSPMARRILREGALLLEDEEAAAAADLVSFGYTSRSLASLMFVPIRSGANTIGILSIQSYAARVYTAEDLRALQALADHCGGALERTRAAEQLRENEARYRALSELTSDYVFAMRVGPDGQRHMEWMTGAFMRITRYTVEEIEERGGWESLVHPDDQPSAERQVRKVLSGQADVSEFRIITKQGDVRWLRSYTRPEWDAEQERVVRVLGAMQDITERKRTEEAMFHAQKLESLGVLAGGLAHDFNNLLMAIIGNAELALFDLPPASPARPSLAEIETAARRAADLTSQMLAYAGKGRFVLQRVDLNTAIKEMAHLIQAATPKGVTLDYRLAPTLSQIEADPAQIGQVLMNLLVNAAEAIGEEAGTITVTTGTIEADRAYLDETYLAPDLPTGTYAWIEVSDTGCGMSPVTQRKIFEPFFTTKFTGRGLGLAAVLGIVRGHRGALQVQSAPGRGTTFRVLFPALPAEAAARRSRGTVLVVIDEEAVRTVTTRMLERLGFAVLTATDGQTGIETFQAHAAEIDCTLLDMTMARMSVEEIVAALQGIRSDAAVLLISSYSEQEMRQRFGAIGLAGFLQKPYSPAELREALQQALRVGSSYAGACV